MGAGIRVGFLGSLARLWQSARVQLMATDLERAFSDCFLGEYRTLLVGGGDEPVYLPSAEPEVSPHRVIYRADYFASALHEVAHWCLAGEARRAQEDYGYWYAADGRDAEQQSAFEKAGARPQALEWILSDTVGFDFHLSADNLESGVGPSSSFSDAVGREKARLTGGLPPRAGRFRATLASLVRSDSAARG